MPAIKRLILLYTLTAVSCVNAPPSGDVFSQEMNRIDQTYKVSPQDSEETRKTKEVLAGNARVEAMKARESSRVFKNTVLRTTLSERSCPEWRPYFALEAIECKATYNYAMYLTLQCENKNLRIKPSTSIRWRVSNHEGIESPNKMGAISARFQKNRIVKSIGGPPLEDENIPATFDLVVAGTEIKIRSAQDASVPIVIPDKVCE